MSKFIITLTQSELELVSALCRTFRDYRREDRDTIESITALEKSLSEQTAGKYGTITADTTYAVVEHVNPYDSHLYHNGEEVLKYDGATPVEWIVSKHETRKEAQEALWDLACSYEANRDNDNLQYENDSQKKEGIYYRESGWPMMLRGDSSFSFDVEHFRIEEM